MRFFGAFLLIAVAAGLAVLAWGALSNLWAEYQDSPDSTYLLSGLPLALLSVLCVAGAVQLVRTGRP